MKEMPARIWIDESLGMVGYVNEQPPPESDFQYQYVRADLLATVFKVLCSFCAEGNVPVDIEALRDLFALLERDNRGQWSFKSLSKDASKFNNAIERLAPSATAAPVQQSDELADEVQRRMDQVVEAAVEWHQAGREGGEWFEAAESLGAAIDSLLELRSDPQTAT